MFMTKRLVIITYLLCLVGGFLSLSTHAELQKDVKYFLSQDQRLLMSYLLQSTRQSAQVQTQINNRAYQFIASALQREPEIIKVNSFDEFLDNWKGKWPDTHSLDLDLQIIEAQNNYRFKIYQSNYENVQQQIDQYQKDQIQYLLKNSNINIKAIDHGGNQNNLSQSNVALVQLLNKVSQKDKLNTQELVLLAPLFYKVLTSEGTEYFDHKLTELDSLGEKLSFNDKNNDNINTSNNNLLNTDKNDLKNLSPVQNDKIPKMDSGLKRIISLMLENYFKHLSLDSKKQALNIMMGMPLNSSPMEHFAALVSASGPLFQKLLQIMAREKGLNPDMIKVFKDLESTVRPVPWILVKDIFASEKNNYAFQAIEEKPLGVGTVAQVHRAFLMQKSAGETEAHKVPIVVRFLKPGVKELVAEDKRILTEISPFIDRDDVLREENFPLLTPMVNDIVKAVENELELETTIENQKLGRKVYSQYVANPQAMKINVPNVISPLNGPSQLMVQELVTGEKLDHLALKLKSKYPDFKKQVIETLAEIWIKEVIFGNGFYHADLHQGNFLVSFDGGYVVKLNLLDFGMSGTLSLEERSALIKLGLTTEVLNAQGIAEAFWQMSDKSKNTTNFSDFKDKVQVIRDQIYQGEVPKRKIVQWVSFAMESGIVLPYELINVNRGFVIMNKLLEDVNSEYTLSIITNSTAKKHPITTLETLWKTKNFSLVDLVKAAYYGTFNKNAGRSFDPIDGSESLDVHVIPVKNVPKTPALGLEPQASSNLVEHLSCRMLFH